MLTTSDGGILESLMPKARRLILAVLLLEPEQKWHLRALARETGLSAPTIRRETQNLSESGIVKGERSGNRTYYSANSQSSIYSELRSIVIKTAGVIGQIRTALLGSASRIETAYVYGSFAEGTARANSDIDLMIVGPIGFEEAIRILEPAEETTGREINATVYAPSEYRKKLALRRGFAWNVHNGPKIPLIGENNEP